MLSNGQPPPVLPAYSEDGIDLTLIRWMLSMTPEERLQTLQQFVNTVHRIREMNSDD